MQNTPEMTYNLCESLLSNNFYSVLKSFTDRFLSEVTPEQSRMVTDFSYYAREKDLIPDEGHDELLLQYLMIPVFSNQYAKHAHALSRINYKILKVLYQLRQNHSKWKPLLDPIRGKLSSKWLTREAKIESTDSPYFLQNLLNWMEASGEFREEVARLRVWDEFLGYQSMEYRRHFYTNATSLWISFQKLSRIYLAPFVAGVKEFVASSREKYYGREDYFFTGRAAEEYYLNMLGAELMNRALRDEFQKTQKKVVLLPTCMRNQPEGCKALINGSEMKCTGCRSDCNAGKIYHRFRNIANEVVLIPHSSDFSNWLKKWEGQKETGLIGVACVLNLLLGGYEMKNLKIPSQCVFLDFPGCRNHWDINGRGIPTNLSHPRLNEILSLKEQAQL